LAAKSIPAKGGYLIKIVPPFGYRVFRLEFSRRHIAVAVAASLIAFFAVGGYYVATIKHAEARVWQLRDVTDTQREQLQRIDAQAVELDNELKALEKQNDQIRRMIGAGDARHAAKFERDRRPAADGRQSMAAPRPDAFNTVAAHIERLRQDSDRVKADGDGIRNVALRVLNMDRLEDLARARVLAAIPSINPAGGSGIASGFGWRLDPWPEFHKGVDLDANYGDPVRAAAAGTVVAAGYDGGYGNKIDIDHGNGYHTWYCHLSRIDIHTGQYVMKAQHIALVGSTGESTGPHLHYQVMLDNQAVDPSPYLSGVPPKVLASLK
jgi:murein DD-endopeptidase MepM/ murein hydrolase activator NlpD